MLRELERRNYYIHLGDWRWHVKLVFMGFQEVEKRLLWRGKFSAKEKMFHIWGPLRVQFGCIMGHVHGQGDTFAWKEGPGTYYGKLKLRFLSGSSERHWASHKRGRPPFLCKQRIGGTGREPCLWQMVALRPWANYLNILSPGFLTSSTYSARLVPRKRKWSLNKGGVGDKWKEDTESRNTVKEDPIRAWSVWTRVGWILHNWESFLKKKHKIFSIKVNIYLEQEKKS